MHNRFPRNAEGDFYTSGTQNQKGEWSGDCLACTLLEQKAPTLLSPSGDDHYNTYFIKQPKTEEELQQAINAAGACCVNAIRYGGKDKKIIRRMLPAACDYKVNIMGKVVPASSHWWQC